MSTSAILSGDAPAGTMDRLYRGEPAHAKLLDDFPVPQVLPDWMSERDLHYYVAAFQKTGVSGALGFYRNLEHDYPKLKAIHGDGSNRQPVLFIGGAEEASVGYGSLEPMRQAVPGLVKCGRRAGLGPLGATGAQ